MNTENFDKDPIIEEEEKFAQICRTPSLRRFIELLVSVESRLTDCAKNYYRGTEFEAFEITIFRRVKRDLTELNDMLNIGENRPSDSDNPRSWFQPQGVRRAAHTDPVETLNWDYLLTAQFIWCHVGEVLYPSWMEATVDDHVSAEHIQSALQLLKEVYSLGIKLNRTLIDFYERSLCSERDYLESEYAGFAGKSGELSP